MKNEEVEVKLSLPPEQANSFRRSTLLRDHKVARAQTAQLISTYFDTPSLGLRRNGMALRIRQAGGLREQTLKWSNKPSSGLQSRTEFNTPIEADVPDFGVLKEAGMRDMLSATGSIKKIAPVFATDVKRTTWLLDFNGSRIEVALDEGEIRSDDRVEPISEIELELKDGEPVALIDLAILIAGRLNVCPAVDSKAGRGYALFDNEKRTAKKVKSPELTADDTVVSAFQTFMHGGIKQLLENRQVIIDGEDAEGVHQGRIAVRRMRAAVSVFKPILEEGSLAKAQAELRWMQQELGPARDWDVFLETTVNPLLARLPDSAALRALAKAAQAQQEAGYERARAFLSSRRFAVSLLWLERWLLEVADESRKTEPLVDFAARLLQSRRKKARRKAGENVTALPEATLHELRIELKKLRYTAQLFKSLYPGAKTDAYMQRLSAMQDCLGGLNDAAVQRGLLQQLKEAGTPANRDAQAILAGWHAAHTQTGLAHLAALWADFAAAKPFWR
ncbi:MAG: CHAD domain-containing protein [Alphaproteobacteria bacterium]